MTSQNFGGQCCHTHPKAFPSTIGILPVWSSESLSARTPAHIALGTAKYHSVIAANKGDNF
jgi:hypothetical protein